MGYFRNPRQNRDVSFVVSVVFVFNEMLGLSIAELSVGVPGI